MCIGQPFCLAIVLAFKKTKKGTHVLKLTLTDITAVSKTEETFSTTKGTDLNRQKSMEAKKGQNN